MKSLNVALMEYFEAADFAPSTSAGTRFLAIREGILDEAKLLPALIFEILPVDWDELSGAYSDTIIISVVGALNDANLSALSVAVQQYVMEMRGKDIEGLLIQSITRPFSTRRDFDIKAGQIQYLLTFDVKWSGESL